MSEAGPQPSTHWRKGEIESEWGDMKTRPSGGNTLSICRTAPLKPKRRLEWATGHVWSYDFVKAMTHDGRALRILVVIDEYTRECLALRVERRLGSLQGIEVLADVMLERGIPEHIRSDNGPEFIAKELGQKDEPAAVRMRHRGERAVASGTRPGLDAFTTRRHAGQPLESEADRPPGPRPACTARAAMREPCIGVRMQPVVHVKCHDFDAGRLRRGERGMQQRGRIAPAAVSDADAGHAPYRSVVSVKRPYDCSRS